MKTVIAFLTLILLFPCLCWAQSLSMPPDSVAIGDTVAIPVLIDPGNLMPTSFQFTLSYDASVVRYDTISTDGDIGEDFFVIANPTTRNITIVAGASTKISGKGILLHMVFIGHAIGETVPEMTDAYLNETPVNTSTGTIYCKETLLPVTLLAYRALAIDPESVVIAWRATGEIELSHYQVSRKNIRGRGGSIFEEVCIKTAYNHPDVTLDYKCLDSPVGPGTYQYRLLAIDYDGSRKEVLSPPVYMGRYQDPQVWPSPVKAGQTLWISIEPSETAEIPVKIYTILGQLVRQDAIPVSSRGPRPLDTTGLSPGVYIIHLARPATTFSRSVVVM